MHNQLKLHSGRKRGLTISWRVIHENKGRVYYVRRLILSKQKHTTSWELWVVPGWCRNPGWRSQSSLWATGGVCTVPPFTAKHGIKEPSTRRRFHPLFTPGRVGCGSGSKGWRSRVASRQIGAPYFYKWMQQCQHTMLRLFLHRPAETKWGLHFCDLSHVRMGSLRCQAQQGPDWLLEIGNSALWSGTGFGEHALPGKILK